METAHTSPSRPGTPGLDVFKIAGRSISGFLHSLKTGDHRHPRQPFTTHLEEQLALYLEYHPHVRSYQRGDASLVCAQSYGLATPLGTPYRISYVFDDQPHDYLPDFVGTLCDGGLLIAEAGRASEKRQGQPLAKAEAARRLAQLKGGIYWIGTDENLSGCRHYNLTYLHARRQSFSTYDEIAATPLLPDPLPSSLEENTSPGEVSLHQNNEPDEVLLGHQGVIPGPTFDASVLKTPEQRTRFHRNLTAVTEVLTGGTLPQVAQKYEMTVSVLGRLVQRAKELGQIACVPYATYHRDRALRPEFQELIRKLYTHPMRPTIMAVYEDVGLKRLAEELSKREGTLVKTPTYRQVQYFLKEISQEP